MFWPLTKPSLVGSLSRAFAYPLPSPELAETPAEVEKPFFDPGAPPFSPVDDTLLAELLEGRCGVSAALPRALVASRSEESLSPGSLCLRWGFCSEGREVSLGSLGDLGERKRVEV
jgi:hypothetical protein